MKLTTGDVYDKLRHGLEEKMDGRLGNEPTLLGGGSEKLVQAESTKKTKDVTQASGAEELCRLPLTNMPPYPLGYHKVQGGDTAQGSTRGDFVKARLGKKAGGGDERGEYADWARWKVGHWFR